LPLQRLILTTTRLLIPARKLAYTKANVLSTWKLDGIHPFNPNKVLRSWKAEAEASPKSIAIPITPRTSRVSWAHTKQALALIQGRTLSAEKLKVQIAKMVKALQQAITNKEINEHLHQQYRQAVSSVSTAATNDRRRLTKARVITTEDVVRLRVEREAAEAKRGRGRCRGRGRGRGRGGGNGPVVLPIAGIAPPTTPPPIPGPDSENTTSGMRGRGRGRLRGRPRGSPRGRPRGRGRGGRSVTIDKEVVVYSLEDSEDTREETRNEIE
jgi:hypothetical protein